MKPSSARWAMWASTEPASRRRRAEDDDAAAALQARDGGVEEALQLDQLGRVGDPGGVEDERLGLALGAGPFGLDAVEHGGDRLAEPTFRRGAGEDRAGDDRLALLVAVERDRLGQAQLLGDGADERRVDNL